MSTRATSSAKLFYFIYRHVGWPLIYSVFRILALFNLKIRHGFELRQVAQTKAKPDEVPAHEPTICIHCASGEFEYAKPVITRLKKRAPELRILITYFSPSYVAMIKKFPGVDAVYPLPWDTPRAIRSFLDEQNVRLVLIARTDTWPEFLHQVHLRRIPSLLFAATLSSKAGRGGSMAGRWMSRAVFANLDAIHCVSNEDREGFERLGVGGKVRIAGDTRFDQVTTRLLAPKPLRDELFGDPEKTIVCGSTWPEDEKVLIEAAAACPQFQFVFAPHEPTEPHLLDLEKRLGTSGLAAVRYSEAEAGSTARILIIDRVGLLAELYSKATYAFVGGSFRKTVHSVMEPLAAGCVTLVGPLHHNNREATEFMALDRAYVQEVRTPADIARILEGGIRPSGDEIRKEISNRSGASDTVVDWIKNNFRSTS